MPRYIDADKLLDDLGLRKGITVDEIINGIPEKGIRPMDEPHCWFFLSIMLAPTADVKPVAIGKWKILDKHTVQCPVCNNTLDLRGVNAGRGDANYCPNCGADMRSRLHGTEIDGTYIDISGDGTVIEQI